MPFLPAVLPTRGRKREAAKRDEAARLLCNIWLAFLNDGYAGAQVASVCLTEPGVAQRRIQDSLLSRARVFLRDVGEFALRGEAEIRDFARLGLNDYQGKNVARPLGVRSGVPLQAGRVDAAEALRVDRPDLAVQCEDPSMLFFDPPRFEEAPNKVFKFLDKSYPAYVENAVQS